MNIIKIVGVIIKDGQYLVARDKDEDFFKNVGGRKSSEETDLECLKRELFEEINFELKEDSELIFDLPPTPALGDLGQNVVLRGYLVSKNKNIIIMPKGNTAELAWIDTNNKKNYKLTPQITDLIIPKLCELGFIK